VPGSCTGYRPLEVVDENLPEALPGVDGVVGEAFQPGQRCRLQSYRKVDDFGSVGAAGHLNGSGVTAEPLLGGLLTIILGDADRLETLRVLVAVESRSERRKTITAVSIVPLSYLAFPSPRVDDGLDVTPVIDLLAKVWLLTWAVGLPHVVRRRWLPPPSGDLTPTRTIVVIAALGSRAIACWSTWGLAPAVSDALVPDERCRGLLVQLDPCPLGVAERLSNGGIVTSLE
jgi:hypothetical protein